jgi:hypothetical protein
LLLIDFTNNSTSKLKKLKGSNIFNVILKIMKKQKLSIRLVHKIDDSLTAPRGNRMSSRGMAALLNWRPSRI